MILGEKTWAQESKELNASHGELNGSVIYLAFS